ncbi:hypothetical protein ABIC01_005569 [Bradyrhizobium sp. RT4b]
MKRRKTRRFPADEDRFVFRIRVQPENVDPCVAFEVRRQIDEHFSLGPICAKLLGQIVDQPAPNRVSQHLVRAIEALDDGLGRPVTVEDHALAVEIAERAVRPKHVRHLSLRSCFGVGQANDRRSYEIDVVDGHDRWDFQAGRVEKTLVVKTRARVVATEMPLTKSVVDAPDGIVVPIRHWSTCRPWVRA